MFKKTIKIAILLSFLYIATLSYFTGKLLGIDGYKWEIISISNFKALIKETLLGFLRIPRKILMKQEKINIMLMLSLDEI